ncbi:MAG TPA: glycoside hydrolase family 32 protein [Armatimonadota bacterium]|jgi:beta-fructofuranosidase
MNEASQPDYTSRAPRYTFADNLAEQEAELAANPLLARFAESRRRLARDPHRPLYHFVSPESGLNDPNGLCFWRGQWHLFYQGYPPEDPRPHWGHAVSDDLVSWRDLPYAIYPQPEEASWSGSTLVEAERVIAMYHGHLLGNMVAVAGDPLLLNWRKLTGAAVIPQPGPIWEPLTGAEAAPGLGGNPPPAGAINFVYDPCIWKRDGVYYSLSGGALPHPLNGKRTRNEFLFRSRDLVSWEYLHPFVEGDIFGLVGDDGACPYFWPLGDRHILLHFSHMSGAQYLLGDYDTRRDKFVATAGGSFTFGTCYPGGVHAPTASPDGAGGLVALFNINTGKPTPGWNHLMSLPRRLTLIGRDELGIEPAGDLASLRGEHQPVAPRLLPANQEVVFENLSGNAMELVAEIEPQGASLIEMKVLRSPGQEEYTRITLFQRRGYRNWERYSGWEGRRVEAATDSVISVDTSHSSQLPDVLSRPPETAPVYLPPGEPWRLRIFLDRSVIEVFVNGRQCLALRVYPGRADSLGVSLLAQGQEAKLLKLDAWQMNSIYS